MVSVTISEVSDEEVTIEKPDTEDADGSGHDETVNSSREPRSTVERQQPPVEQSPKPKTFSEKWSALIQRTHMPVIRFLQVITSLAARNPKRTVCSVVAISVSFLVAGLLTNFHLELDEGDLWAPKDSISMRQSDWAASQGYLGSGNYILLMFHAEGRDVLGQRQIERVFDAYDTITGLDGYDDMCSKSWYYNSDGERTCEVEGLVRFFNFSSQIFEETVSSDEQAAARMSKLHYPDGFPVSDDSIFSGFTRSNETFVLDDGEKVGVLTSATSFFVRIQLSYTYAAVVMEQNAIDAIVALDNQWRSEDGAEPLLFVEVTAGRSFGDEFLRGIYADLPLGTFLFEPCSLWNE